MFRTQTNAFDEVIAKATDENLTSENWEYMMDAWERVNSGGENGPKDAVAALIKRLAHRNANVQLYTLEMANAFTQNCGPEMRRELASRAFTDALLRLAGDRNTHAAVKSKILEKMGEWTEMFKSDPGLGIMEQAYNRLKSSNPNIQPPSKPTKREITDIDRQKEDEELQMALEISLKEKSNPAQGYKPAQVSSSNTQASTAQALAPQPETAPHTTAATVSRVRALYDFIPSESGELAFRKGDIIAVLESVFKDWWMGSLRGQTGIFPLNYVEKLSDPTVEELQKDAQMEAEVFGQIKNVEKLLALLSTSEGNASVQDNEEITTLYHSTLQIRPKLIELIGKYSQKKDEFVALNEKFIKARRDYEALLESSMSQTAVAHYGRPPAAGNPYTYPPGDGFSEPSRYYTSGPQAQIPSASPQNAQGAYPPPQQKPEYGNRRTSNQYYPQQPHDDHPPQGGPAPFYVVGQLPPGSQLQPGSGSGSPAPHHAPQNVPPAPPGGSGIPSHQADGPSQPPQELATSIYDTPIDGTHEASFAAGRPISPAHVPSTPYGGGYQAYQHHHPQRPLSTHQPSYPGQETDPILPPTPYPQPQGSSAPPQGYQAYPSQRQPQNYYTPQNQPLDLGSALPQAPQDYYGRQSEMFLPNGNRARG